MSDELPETKHQQAWDARRQLPVSLKCASSRQNDWLPAIQVY